MNERTTPHPIQSALKNELLRRCRRNPRYSLRSFAMSLGVDQSLLSKIIKGERKPSAKMIWQVGQAINISPEKLQEIADAHRARVVATYQLVDKKALTQLTDWYYFAILELHAVKGFSQDSKWIARKLDITVAEVNIAIEKLAHAGRIQIDKNGKWILLQPSNTWTSFTETDAIKKRIQKQFLDRALKSIDSVPFEQRENASLTFAINSELIPKLKKKIDRFLDSLQVEAEKYGKANSVFQTCVSLFPLTKIDFEKK